MKPTPKFDHLPALDACLIAVEQVLGRPNPVVAAVVAAMCGTDLDATWTPSRFREVVALIVGAASNPIPKELSPTLQTAIRLVGLDLAAGLKGREAIAPLVCSFALHHNDDPEPLRAWLAETPPIPPKTLRRRAKFAARATLALETSR